MAGDHHFRTVPVLLVGAGPAGLAGAVTLARHGVGSLLVERNPGLSPLPRATGVSVRTMELLRSFGLEEQVRAGEVAIVEAGAWATETLASPEGVMFPSGFPTRRQVAAVTPTMLAAVPQDHLEPLLLAHLRSHPTAEVRFATELAGFDQDAEGVTATLRDVRSGASTVVRARYLVGSDGAHSGGRTASGWRTTPRPGSPACSAPPPASRTCARGSSPWGRSRSRPRSPSATAPATPSWSATPPTG